MSTRSTLTISQHVSVEDVEDDKATNDGSVLDRYSDSLMELSDDDVDSEASELSGVFAPGIQNQHLIN